LELTVTLDKPEQRVQLFGSADVNLRFIREICQVQITARHGRVKFSGTKKAVTKAVHLLELMQERLKSTDHISKNDMTELTSQATRGRDLDKDSQLRVYVHDRIIRPRTTGQEKYCQAIQQNDLVFCAGPAGTGKTYLAVASAVAMLKRKQIRRIVLARPAVEAGEKLGFLPGDLQAKVNPYLRPLFDALGDMMSALWSTILSR